MTETIDNIETRILSIEPEMTVETIAEVVTKFDFMKKRIREVEGQLKGRLIEYISTNGSFMIGNMAYSVGDDSEWQCQDVAGTVDAMIETAQGDTAVVASYLCSQPFKAGSLKKFLPADKFAELFKRVTKPKLNIVGEKVPSLQIVNTQFV